MRCIELLMSPIFCTVITDVKMMGINVFSMNMLSLQNSMRCNEMFFHGNMMLKVGSSLYLFCFRSEDGRYLVTGECGHLPSVRVWDIQVPQSLVLLSFFGPFLVFLVHWCPGPIFSWTLNSPLCNFPEYPWDHLWHVLSPSSLCNPRNLGFIPTNPPFLPS